MLFRLLSGLLCLIELVDGSGVDDAAFAVENVRCCFFCPTTAACLLIAQRHSSAPPADSLFPTAAMKIAASAIVTDTKVKCNYTKWRNSKAAVTGQQT